jgi:undecaprenyl-diphosphatase
MAFAWHLIYGGLRTLGVKISSFYVTLGVFMVGGIAIAIVGAVGFSELAEHVLGQTPPVDIAILTWLHDRQSPLLTSFMLEMTYLGTGTVVVAIVGITALFLWHTEHKLSARLLLASTIGNIILNGALKLVYHRARPNIFQWQTEAVSSSFPSGHAMSATVVYGTVAYLLMRLQKHHWSRVLTLCGAVVVIALICTSRMYLGVHYPSDVIGGVIVGLAWASFCMATLEASIVVARRRQSAAVEHEAPAPSEKVEPVPEWNI